MSRLIIFLIVTSGIVMFLTACVPFRDRPYSSMNPIQKAFADGRRNRLKYRGGSAARDKRYQVNQERRRMQDFNRVLKEQNQMIKDYRAKQGR